MPWKGGSVPWKGGSVPWKGGSVPWKGGSVPWKGGSVPWKGGSVPWKGGSVPGKEDGKGRQFGDKRIQCCEGEERAALGTCGLELRKKRSEFGDQRH